MNNIFCLLLLSLIYGCSDPTTNLKPNDNNDTGILVQPTETIETLKIDETPDTQEPNEAIKIEVNKLPKGEYTIKALIKAFQAIEISDGGSIDIYDDSQKISDLDHYQHAPGDIEFTFVIKNSDGATQEEINRTLTILEENAPEEKDNEEPNKPDQNQPLLTGLAYDAPTKTFTWDSTYSGTLTITLNGNVIDSIPVSEKSWVFSSPEEGWNQITFSQGELSVSDGFNHASEAKPTPNADPIITRLNFDLNTKTYTWNTSYSGDLTISINGKFIASIPVTNKTWTIPSPEEGWNQVTFAQGNLTVSDGFSYTTPAPPVAERKFTDAKAAMDWETLYYSHITYAFNRFYVFLESGHVARFEKDGIVLSSVSKISDSTLFSGQIADNYSKLTAIVPYKFYAWETYFFFENSYKFVYFDRMNRASNGYPRGNITNFTYENSEVFTGLVTAACQHTNPDWEHHYYFLSDGRWLEYHMLNQELVNAPAATSQTFDFTDQEAKDITACVRLTAERYLFFLKGGKVVKFNMTTKKKESGYPKLMEEEWPTIFDHLQ